MAATVDGELVAPEGTQEGKNTCPILAIRLQPLPTVSPEELRGENKGQWPQTAEVHVKGMTSVSPDTCIFPYIVKH